MDTCEADGGGELTQVLEQRLGIRLDERTADGSVSLEGLECIGLCGIGRAALIDDMPVLGQDSILRAVDDLSR